MERGYSEILGDRDELRVVVVTGCHVVWRMRSAGGVVGVDAWGNEVKGFNGVGGKRGLFDRVLDHHWNVVCGAAEGRSFYIDVVVVVYVVVVAGVVKVIVVVDVIVVVVVRFIVIM